MKTLKINEETHKQLQLLKVMTKAKTLDEVIKHLNYIIGAVPEAAEEFFKNDKSKK